MRIAIVEDDLELARILRKGLAAEGHDIDLFHTAESASALEGRGNAYDHIILDLMLPDGDGAYICKNVRDAGIATPILILTARDSIEDRVTLLDRGADDFLGKPFSFDELLARMRAVSRRRPALEEGDLRVGELRVLPAQRLAYRGSASLSLTPREFDLLLYLMRSAERVVDRDELMARVWREAPGHTNVVDVHVRKLRMKVDEGRDTKYIHTVHGVGYTIAARRA